MYTYTYIYIYIYIYTCIERERYIVESIVYYSTVYDQLRAEESLPHSVPFLTPCDMLPVREGKSYSRGRDPYPSCGNTPANTAADPRAETPEHYLSEAHGNAHAATNTRARARAHRHASLIPIPIAARGRSCMGTRTFGLCTMFVLYIL